MFLGAINKNTNKYVYPNIANKLEEYICSDCNENVILCKGNIIQPYFRHERNSTCEYYTKPSESQIHKDAKMLMKYILDNHLPFSLSRKCSGCYNPGKINVSALIENCEIITEYRFDHNGLKIADVACVNNGSVICIFEICHTHKTLQENRPEPWFEINATELIQAVRSKNNFIKLFCIRSKRCGECVQCLRCNRSEHPRTMASNLVTGVCKQCDTEIWDRIYLNVPYSEKNAAKKLGAEFDGKVKKWFISSKIKTRDVILSKWNKCNVYNFKKIY